MVNVPQLHKEQRGIFHQRGCDTLFGLCIKGQPTPNWW